MKASIAVISLVRMTLFTVAMGVAGVKSVVFAQEQSPASTALMSEAVDLMSMADALDAQSHTSIKRSSELRKSIGAARVQLAKLAEDKSSRFLSKQIELQNKHLESWKQQGATLRQQSAQLKRQSHKLFTMAMLERWAAWISNPNPMRSADHNTTLTSAHNVRVRSVHPRMPEPTPALTTSARQQSIPPSNTKRSEQAPDTGASHLQTPAANAALRPSPISAASADNTMSLDISAVAGQQLPAGLNVESFNISRARKLFAHIEVEPDANGERTIVPINKLHQWRLILARVDGKPLSDAEITFTGHMPGHVHGLPTQPKIDQQLDDGVYQVSGVKFQMAGWWVIEFVVKTAQWTDYVRFNIVL